MGRFIVCAALLVLFTANRSEAYFDSGNALYATCQGTQDFKVASCMATIIGHYDMMMALGYRCGDDSKKTKQQLRDVVVKYMQDNPAERSGTAAEQSFIAVFRAFNCQFPVTESPAKKQPQ